MRILIVDDSRAMRMIVRRTLRQTGLNITEVQEAENGVQALETLAAFHPDVVFSDWNMPEMNGIDFLTEARARGYRRPFIFVTSQASEEMRKEALEKGAHDFITKPFTADDFTVVVSALGL